MLAANMSFGLSPICFPHSFVSIYWHNIISLMPLSSFTHFPRQPCRRRLGKGSPKQIFNPSEYGLVAWWKAAARKHVRTLREHTTYAESNFFRFVELWTNCVSSHLHLPLSLFIIYSSCVVVFLLSPLFLSFCFLGGRNKLLTIFRW